MIRLVKFNFNDKFWEQTPRRVVNKELTAIARDIAKRARVGSSWTKGTTGLRNPRTKGTVSRAGSRSAALVHVMQPTQIRQERIRVAARAVAASRGGTR